MSNVLSSVKSITLEHFEDEACSEDRSDKDGIALEDGVVYRA